MITFKELAESTREHLRNKLERTKTEIHELESEHSKALASADRHEARSKDSKLSFEERRFAQQRAEAFKQSAKNTRGIIEKKRKRVVQMAKSLLSGEKK